MIIIKLKPNAFCEIYIQKKCIILFFLFKKKWWCWFFTYIRKEKNWIIFCVTKPNLKTKNIYTNIRNLFACHTHIYPNITNKFCFFFTLFFLLYKFYSRTGSKHQQFLWINKIKQKKFLHILFYLTNTNEKSESKMYNSSGGFRWKVGVF